MTETLMGWVTQWWARLVSILLAASAALLILIWPPFIAASSSQINHGLLSLQMLAICGCFVHGLGFDPKHPIPRWLFSPYLCWPVILLSLIDWVR